jgi:hypothetical protein
MALASVDAARTILYLAPAAGFEAPAVVAGFNDVAVMGDAIKQRYRLTGGL